MRGQPISQKLESIFSTFLPALNLAVIRCLVEGLMSTYFAFWDSITCRCAYPEANQLLPLTFAKHRDSQCDVQVGHHTRCLPVQGTN